MITFNRGVLTQNVLSGPGIRKIFHSVASETECCANSSPKGIKTMLQCLFLLCVWGRFSRLFQCSWTHHKTSKWLVMRCTKIWPAPLKFSAALTTKYVTEASELKKKSSLTLRRRKYGDTLPHTAVGVCGEFQRTGRFLQRGIWSQCVVPRSAVPSVRSSL